MRVHCTNRMNVVFRFVSFFFLLPVLINASLSVCECVCVQFSLFPPSTKWWPLQSVSSLKLIAQTIRTPTQDGCVCAFNYEYESFNVQWHINTWVSVCVRRRNSWSFISFVFACICDNLLKSSVVFASPLCVYLPWRVICIAISGLHTQQFGFFRNQENK